MKQDAVPGITTSVKVTPKKLGTYEVICTELCGLGHSVMRAQARVLSSEDYDAWLQEQAGGAAGGEGGEGGKADGQAIFTDRGCGGCHTLADAGSTAQVGPNLDTVLEGVDADIRVLANLCERDAAAGEAYGRFSDACQRFLSRSVRALPALPKHAPAVGARVNTTPRVWERPDSPFGHAVMWLGRAVKDALRDENEG